MFYECQDDAKRAQIATVIVFSDEEARVPLATVFAIVAVDSVVAGDEVVLKPRTNVPGPANESVTHEIVSAFYEDEDSEGEGEGEGQEE